MTTFSQWRLGLVKSPTPKQFTWVCGTERVLVEEIIDYIKDTLDPDLIPMSVGEDSERSIWAEVEQHPMGKRPRLILIRNAEKLTRTDKISQAIAYRAENPNTHVLYVSGEESAPRHIVDEKSVLLPHLAAFGAKGHVIECKPFTQATAKHAVAWVLSKVPMRAGIAGHLLERANGDLRLVRDVCRKLAVFPDEITLTTINLLLAERPRDTFSDALLILDKKTALLALQTLPVGEYSRMIGYLDARLDLAGLVHDLVLEHKTPSEIARAAGRQSFLVKDVLPVAKHYDAKRRLAIRQVLAIADEALRGGNTDGVLESVVVFW